MASIGLFGSGHLARALLAGFQRSGAEMPRVHARSAASRERIAREFPGAILVDDPAALAAQGDGFVLGLIPPAAVLDIEPRVIDAWRAAGATFVSCAGGVTVEHLEQRYPGLPVVRALPSITSRVGRGVTLLQAGTAVAGNRLTALAGRLEVLGPVHVVRGGDAFYPLGLLTSCGPGLYAALFDALFAAFGVEDADGRNLALEALAGTVEDLLDSGHPPRALIDEVARPGGLTGSGVAALRVQWPALATAVRGAMEARARERDATLAALASRRVPTDFNAAAATWDDDPAKVERARRVAAAIVETVPFRAGLTGFEYGCGTGLVSFELRGHLAHITLADSSEGMLRVLGEKIAAAGATNMTPVRLDLLSDPLPEERFDVVYTSMTLHHVADVDHALRCLEAMLLPGGYVCIADLDAEDGSFHGPGVDVHHGFDRADLRVRLAALGLADIRFRTVYEIAKDTGRGTTIFPVFLATARRE